MSSYKDLSKFALQQGEIIKVMNDKRMLITDFNALLRRYSYASKIHDTIFVDFDCEQHSFCIIKKGDDVSRKFYINTSKSWMDYKDLFLSDTDLEQNIKLLAIYDKRVSVTDINYFLQSRLKECAGCIVDFELASRMGASVVIGIS